MAIKSLLEKLNDAITDFSSLEVATFTKSTGEKVQVDLSSEDVTTNDIFKNIRANLKAGQQTRKNIYDTVVGLFKKNS